MPDLKQHSKAYFYKLTAVNVTVSGDVRHKSLVHFPLSCFPKEILDLLIAVSSS